MGLPEAGTPRHEAYREAHPECDRWGEAICTPFCEAGDHTFSRAPAAPERGHRR